MKRSRSLWPLSEIVLCSLLVLIFQGCKSQAYQEEASRFPVFLTEYQAVFLSNSQVFFGKADVGAEFVTLNDVFYIQSQVNQDTKEVKSTLIKRGNEWHGPDVMYVNKSQVVLIEPVAADSQVAKLIKEAKNQ
jgi:hypothetical protein